MVRQLTNNNKDDLHPAIDGSLIVYEHFYSSSDIDIHLYDLTTGTVKLVNQSTLSQTAPDISGNRIVYQEPYHNPITNFDGVKVWTVLTDGTGITNLISDRLPSINYSNPIIEGTNVIYEADWVFDGDFYQRIGGRDLTKDVDDTLNNAISIPSGARSNSAAISGNKVVYLADGYLGDGLKFELKLATIISNNNVNTTTLITPDPGKRISSPSIDGNLVVYTLIDENNFNNSDIYLYDISTGANIAISNTSDYDTNAQISGNKIVWQRNNENSREIWAGLSDGSYKIPLATSTVSIGEPAISGNTVVWSGWDGNDWEIFSTTLTIDPVYRFYNPVSRGHFFTANVGEKDSVLAHPEWGYNFEGVGFYASANPGDTLAPVYRFYNPVSRGHFFTANVEEKDSVLAHPEWGYNFEGIGFYAYGADEQQASDIYRFYNPVSQGHFFTGNVGEKDSVLAHPEWGYQFEGVGFEAMT